MPLIIYWPRYQALLFFNFIARHEVQSYTGDTIDKWNWFTRSSTWLRAFSENEFRSENYTTARNQTDDFIVFIRFQLYITYRIPGGMYTLPSTNHIRMVKNFRTNILSRNFMNFLHGVLFNFDNDIATRNSCSDALPCANMVLKLPRYFYLLMEKQVSSVRFPSYQVPQCNQKTPIPISWRWQVSVATTSTGLRQLLGSSYFKINYLFLLKNNST